MALWVLAPPGPSFRYQGIQEIANRTVCCMILTHGIANSMTVFCMIVIIVFLQQYYTHHACLLNVLFKVDVFGFSLA